MIANSVALLNHSGVYYLERSGSNTRLLNSKENLLCNINDISTQMESKVEMR